MVSDPESSEDQLHAHPSPELRERYKRLFGSSHCHHLVPSSRNGQSEEFNLFPWNRKAHQKWHQLFFNLTIFEIWDQLDTIHAAVFSEAERVLPFWLEYCKLERGDARKRRAFSEQKQAMLSTPLSTYRLQSAWESCFGSVGLECSRNVLSYMMLLMVFGARAICDPESFFSDENDGNIETYIKKSLRNKYRRRAFLNCFFDSASTQEVKECAIEIVNSISCSNSL